MDKLLEQTNDLELKANLNPEQREYLEVLKDKMKKVLGGKTKHELAKAGDLESLKKYRTILLEILEFLRTKEVKKLVEYGNLMVLSSQAEFLHLIIEKAVEKGDDDFGKIFEKSMAERTIKDNLRVDDEGNVLSLELPRLYSLEGLNFGVLRRLEELKSSEILDKKIQDKIVIQMPKGCNAIFSVAKKW